MGQASDDGLNTTKTTTPPPDPLDAAADAGWTAYSASVGGKSAVTGADLPTWAALKADPDRVSVVNGWRVAAAAVLRTPDAPQLLLAGALEKAKNCINALLSNGGSAISDEFGDKCRAIVHEARDVLIRTKPVDNPAGMGEAASSAGATTPPDQNLAAQTGI